MIKTLKLSDKTVRRFKTHKRWKFSTLDLEDLILLEQGEGQPLFLDTEGALAPEQQQTETPIKLKYGKRIDGTFFPSDSKYYDPNVDPINYDGSYHRVVYNSVKHLFYNTYNVGKITDPLNPNSSELIFSDKNPLMVFGSETGKYSSLDYTSDVLGKNIVDSERRILGDDVVVLEVPFDVFGEKIKPTSFKLTDYSSPYDKIEVVDDGATNLVIGKESFNDINEVWLGDVTEIKQPSKDKTFDYADLTFGYRLVSDGKYFLTGCPILPTAPSETQTGSSSLYKYDIDSKNFRLVRNFICPFTQNGLSIESQNDNTGFLINELGNILVAGDYSINDNFGDAVELGWGICAIGSSKSHIRGESTDQPTGHVFVYDKNKGGVENWGLINIFEGEPGGEFGTSISVHRDYMAVGSPGMNNSEGAVYIFKKTKRNESHPWIRTSNVYDKYAWSTSKGHYEGIPSSDSTSVEDYKKHREVIVEQRRTKHRDALDENKKRKTNALKEGLMSEEEENYHKRGLLFSNYSDKFPFLLLTEDQMKYYKSSAWPDHMEDEDTGYYIPVPDKNSDELSKNNRWVSRWKVESVVSTGNTLEYFQDDEPSDCAHGPISTFGGEELITDGEHGGYPPHKYSDTPNHGIGDTTWELVGLVRPPTPMSEQFGEVVKLKEDMLYVSNPTAIDKKCWTFRKDEDEYGCETWKHTYIITKSGLSGHDTGIDVISDQFNFVIVDSGELNVEISVCPTTNEYSAWAYRLDKPLNIPNTSADQIITSGGVEVLRCDSECANSATPFIYTNRAKTVAKYQSTTLPANFGDVVSIEGMLVNDFLNNEAAPVFYTKFSGQKSYVDPDWPTDSLAISWKNFRENVQFSYPYVRAGTQPSFMTIYANNAKRDDGTYDPLYTLAEIGAQETLNGRTVKLTLHVGSPSSDRQEIFYQFAFIGSVEGTHYTLDELETEILFDATLPCNLGDWVSLSDMISEDILNNESNARFYSKLESAPSYVAPWFDGDSIAISWKNFREDVQFSYPRVDAGTQPSFMTIYANNAKRDDGTYDPLYTLAEIGAQETLNGQLVRLTLNYGSPAPDRTEVAYEFIFKGLPAGTHYTLDELKTETLFGGSLPTNQGESVSIADMISNDFLINDSNATFYTKPENGPSYVDVSFPDDAIALSWKNIREDVQFSYPYVKSGNQPAFMTIYANNAKQEDGTYDPIYTLAEIGAQETLNGRLVSLTFNSGSTSSSRPEFSYEFVFNGSKAGSHHTLDELNAKITFGKTGLLKEVLTRTKIIPSKSVGTLSANLGESIPIHNMVVDDLLNNKHNAMLYTKPKTGPSYVEPGSFPGAIALSWKNFREDTQFSYPVVEAGDQPSFMTIYSNEALQEDGTYDPIYTLAEIGAQETLNGEIVRLTLNCNTPTPSRHEFFYEFIFNGSIEGTHYTLDELETATTSLGTPLLVHTPLPHTCRHLIDRDELSHGKHWLYVGLVNETGELVGTQSRVIFYTNPMGYEYTPRHRQVKRLYEYEYNVPGAFGTSIDANDNYLVIGDPHDRSYSLRKSPDNINHAGASYVFSISSDEIRFISKLYGEVDAETEFDTRFGNSVSLLGEALVVGGQCPDTDEVDLITHGEGQEELYVNDYRWGANNIYEDHYVAAEALITNFTYEFVSTSGCGNLILKINIASLNVDLAKLNHITIADTSGFMETGYDSDGDLKIKIEGFTAETVESANGLYIRQTPDKNGKPKYKHRNRDWYIYWQPPGEQANEAIHMKYPAGLTQDQEQKYCPFKESGGWVMTDGVYSLTKEDANATNTIVAAEWIPDQAGHPHIPEKFAEGGGNFNHQLATRLPPSVTGAECGDLVQGVYRDLTKKVGDEIWVTVNKNPGVDIPETLVFIYYSKRNAVQGYAYYYNLSTDGNDIEMVKRIKTNKESNSIRKQFSHSVSLSSDFIYIGSPVLGDFNINELTSFGGRELTTLGGTGKMFSEYGDINEGKTKTQTTGLSGTVLAYDTASLRDGNQVYLGNVFYKNGIVTLTNNSGYLSRIFSGSGNRGFEVEFKGTHTIYENEILCSVAPHEFNISTNPTSTIRGNIEYDVDESGQFDISDLGYIYKYLMGSLIPADTDTADEVSGAIPIEGETPNWPNTDVILTESEDVILMNLLSTMDVHQDKSKFEMIVRNLQKLDTSGALDMDGDGISGPIDAKLLVRYFLGRTGMELISNLVNRYGNATRTNASEIVEFLDEKTGKKLGVQILDEFVNYKENDATDRGGSYLAPYATTVGLYAGLDLVMVAKLGKPVKILPNYPINFLVKFDT